jgi:hypothetical protein
MGELLLGLLNTLLLLLLLESLLGWRAILGATRWRPCKFDLTQSNG